MTTTTSDDQLEALDRELLNAVQWDFPLEPRPFAVLGGRLGISEPEVRERIARVKELGLEGVRINQAGCLDRCELGPTLVIYPEGVWYHYQTIEDAEEILQRHIVGGDRVKRLMLKPEDK